MRRVRWFMIAFSMVMAFAPLSGVIAAAAFAWLAGCEINDATVEPCTAFGSDLTPVLSGLTITASLGWVSYSILLLVLAVWGSAEAIIAAFAWWRRMRSSRRLGTGNFDQSGNR